MKFKSDYTQMLFEINDGQMVFTMKYLPKLVEVEISDKPVIDEYGSTGFKILDEGEYNGLLLKEVD